jgi:hypothetical protein
MTMSPTNRETFLIALRVLTQFNGGAEPAAEDAQVLKHSAGPDEKRLRIDALACAIIQRELSAEAA